MKIEVLLRKTITSFFLYKGEIAKIPMRMGNKKPNSQGIEYIAREKIMHHSEAIKTYLKSSVFRYRKK